MKRIFDKNRYTVAATFLFVTPQPELGGRTLFDYQTTLIEAMFVAQGGRRGGLTMKGGRSISSITGQVSRWAVGKTRKPLSIERDILRAIRFQYQHAPNLAEKFGDQFIAISHLKWLEKDISKKGPQRIIMPSNVAITEILLDLGMEPQKVEVLKSKPRALSAAFIFLAAHEVLVEAGISADFLQNKIKSMPLPMRKEFLDQIRKHSSANLMRLMPK